MVTFRTFNNDKLLSFARKKADFEQSVESGFGEDHSDISRSIGSPFQNRTASNIEPVRLINIDKY